MILKKIFSWNIKDIYRYLIESFIEMFQMVFFQIWASLYCPSHLMINSNVVYFIIQWSDSLYLYTDNILADNIHFN